MNAVGMLRPASSLSASPPTSIAVGSCQLGPPNPSAPTRTGRAAASSSDSASSSPSRAAMATSSVGSGSPA